LADDAGILGQIRPGLGQQGGMQTVGQQIAFVTLIKDALATHGATVHNDAAKGTQTTMV
jgi:hypothetical protein